MKLSDFRYLERLRVRWAEVDAQKIVFNGHYLTYFDTAVAGWWRALALPYEQTLADLGGDLFLRRATLDYRAPARWEDVLSVGLRPGTPGDSSIPLQAAVFRGDECLVAGELLYVFADPAAEGKRSVPEGLRAAFAAYEAGEPMVTVRTGRWDELGADAHPIRRAVFVDEQGVPAEREWDEADGAAVHAVAYNRLGRPLATGRMIEHAPGVAKFGRMAVVRAMRGGQVGRLVLDALLQAARRAGYREVVLHAQVSAGNFYRRAGFVPQGPVYEEVGMPHQDMKATL